MDNKSTWVSHVVIVEKKCMTQEQKILHEQNTQFPTCSDEVTFCPNCLQIIWREKMKSVNYFLYFLFYLLKIGEVVWSSELAYHANVLQQEVEKGQSCMRREIHRNKNVCTIHGMHAETERERERETCREGTKWVLVEGKWKEEDTSGEMWHTTYDCPNSNSLDKGLPKVANYKESFFLSTTNNCRELHARKQVHHLACHNFGL